MKCDVTIVGAGPSGLILAKIIASNGFEVIILEEHSEVGVPQHCTGKITINALKDLSLEAAGTLQRVKRATFYAPNLKSFTVKREEVQALIVDRGKFDQYLSKKACKAGAELYTNSRVKKMYVTLDNAVVSFEQKGELQNISCRLVVGADGATSTIAKSAGLTSKSPITMRMGVQREVSNIQTIHGAVELFFGRMWAPGFFAWIVPTGNNTAKVGLGIPLNMTQSAFKFLDAFMENHPIAREKFRESRILRQIAHIIPVGGTLNRTTSDGILVVGDAARQVKSTTGGGLYYGMACAQIAGDTVSKALKTCNDGVLKRKQLVDYENQWRKKFGKEIKMSVKVRAFLDSLSEQEVNYLFDLFRREESLIKRIEMDGDIDYQSKIILSLVKYTRSLIKRPKLVYKLIRFFPPFKLK